MPERLVENSISARLDNLDEIRPFNQVANRIITACNDPDTDAVTLCNIIRCDSAVSLRVMHVANSSLYGSAGEIRTLEHAIVVMGFRAIRNLCLSVAASDLFDSGETCSAQARQALWHHSLYCGTVASCLAQECDVDPDEAFLAGIVHDVGKLIFYDAEPEQYAQVTASSGPKRIVADEMNSFGIDHQEVGRLCADQWGLPREITSAIRAHHLPEQSEENRALVNVVCGADALAHAWQDVPDDAEVDLPAILEPSTLMLSEEQCALVKEKVETEFKSLMDFFNS